MKTEDNFLDGFLLGIAVARSLSFKYDFDKIFDQLRAVATGELSLLPTTEEEIQDFMKVVGRAPTAREIEDVRSSSPASNRRQQDARYKEQAKIILRLMNQPL